jgi:virulence factor Mce-like protein
MRRLAAIALLLVAAVAALVTTGASDAGGERYRVRAIFDNAANVVEGEDVKIAGARVGRVRSLDVTPIDPDDDVPDNKAILELEIEEQGFAPFRTDAECTIRPQSLIGEKFVECQPGKASEELAKVPDGQAGEGQHELPLERTHTPVDLDLVNNTLRMPWRERLAILINEFGTGLAGRGDDLNEAIHRANPALRETDQVLAILAAQNRRLGRLAADSDTVLAPLARDRRRIQGFIERANETAQATAERRDDIEANFERFPRFLPELRSTLDELGGFADEFTPVARDLGDAAPDFNRFIRGLAPFSRAALPAFRSLGEATEDGRPALAALRPILGDLRSFTTDAKPTTKNLQALTQSLDRRGAIGYLMDYLFFQMTAINGFDGVSHYLRANLLTNLCSAYATSRTLGCNANFTATEARRAGSGPRDEQLDAYARGLAAASRFQRRHGNAKPIPLDRLEALMSLADPDITRQREQGLDRIRRGAGRQDGARVDGVAPHDQAALDYLLGGSK